MLDVSSQFSNFCETLGEDSCAPNVESVKTTVEVVAVLGIGVVAVPAEQTAPMTIHQPVMPKMGSFLIKPLAAALAKHNVGLVFGNAKHARKKEPPSQNSF